MSVHKPADWILELIIYWKHCISSVTGYILSIRKSKFNNTIYKFLKMVVLYILLVYFGSYSGLTGSELIDMTHSFTNETLYWPTFKTFELDIQYRGQSENFWFEANNFAAAEHGGTHMDAPSHFAQGKWRLGDIPIDRFISTAVVIDITSKAVDNPDAELTVNDLLEWEQSNGRIPDKCILFMNSGWDKRWPNELLYIGNTNKNASNLHFPGISAEAARWLVDKRDIYAVGVDTASIDHGPSTLFLAHRTFYEENIFGLENVKNLDKLPPVGARVYVFPMKIQDGSGAPCRIMAEVNTSSMTLGKSWIIITLIIIVVFVL